MSPTTITTIGVYLAVAVAVLVLLLQRRQVTQRTSAMPFILALVVGGMYLTRSNPSAGDFAAIVVGGVLGLGTGLVSALFLRVWRDPATGIVWQQGNWRYLAVLLALLAARVLARFALAAMGTALDSSLLDVGFIAMACGNLMGRSLLVMQRTSTLTGQPFSMLG
jgi:hypothetical protein